MPAGRIFADITDPMKQITLLLALVISLHGSSQSVFGYWYGNANVKTNNSASNYMVELVLQPEKNHVKGILNYYFKNTYRSLQVQGNYDAASRQVYLYNIPLTYYGSLVNFEVDCIMNLRATLRVSQEGSYLTGAFVSLPEHKYVCPDVNFSFKMQADISKKDSVLKAISEFKENYQVWKPGIEDTLVQATVIQRKVINPVIEKQYSEREDVVLNEIEVESDSLQVSVYDNGEIDGDIISLFFNKTLIVFNQKLTHKSLRVNLVLDGKVVGNELTMFAENLGLIPPNTALVIISDGKNRFELRLSSSLEKNATIRIKRKHATN
ncbi:MAG: hypothetical protein JNM88_19785 [Chitinophagaceae bacterium]|nr:hypothetical protein [Chitinophagaceae bacterium]